MFHMEACRARVSQSGLKTGGDTVHMVHVASLRRSRENQVEDRQVNAMGYVEHCYSYFAIFIVLDHRSILVFYLRL
jgi:hypothetical protein